MRMHGLKVRQNPEVVHIGQLQLMRMHELPLCIEPHKQHAPPNGGACFAFPYHANQLTNEESSL